MEGASLAEAFADAPLSRELLAWEHERKRVIRVGKWQLVAKAGAGREQYDRDADPVEYVGTIRTLPTPRHCIGDGSISTCYSCSGITHR